MGWGGCPQLTSEACLRTAHQWGRAGHLRARDRNLSLWQSRLLWGDGLPAGKTTARGSSLQEGVETIDSLGVKKVPAPRKGAPELIVVGFGCVSASDPVDRHRAAVRPEVRLHGLSLRCADRLQDRCSSSTGWHWREQVRSLFQVSRIQYR